MTSSVSTKGQVTIPASIRKQLRLSPGSSVEFVVTDEGDVLLRKRFGLAEPLRGLISHLAPEEPVATDALDRAIGAEVGALNRKSAPDLNPEEREDQDV